MRHESLYLNDIVEAADHIAQFIAGVDFQALFRNRLGRGLACCYEPVPGVASADCRHPCGGIRPPGGRGRTLRNRPRCVSPHHQTDRSYGTHHRQRWRYRTTPIPPVLEPCSAASVSSCVKAPNILQIVDRIRGKTVLCCSTDTHANQMQTRQAQTELTAYTLNLDKRTIPAKAVLHDFRVGPGHEGLAAHNPNVASFHYDGEVHFNVTDEIVARTAIVSAA